MYTALFIILIINFFMLFLLFLVIALFAWDFYKFNKNDRERAKMDYTRPRICIYCDNRINEDIVEDEDN